jgi:adenylylsulfate kinase-like enzyme
MIYWFTGQPGHGKTVLSNLLKDKLESLGKKVIAVDGDDIREIFVNKDYTKEGRYKNITLAQQISKFGHLKGFDVVVSLVSPYLELREKFKSDMLESIVEIYVHTTEVRGRENFHSSDYEKPIDNFIDMDTTDISPEESLNEIIKKLNIKND